MSIYPSGDTKIGAPAMTTLKDDAVKIFTEAWEAKNAEQPSNEVWPAGTRVGAGIDALIDHGIIREPIMDRAVLAVAYDPEAFEDHPIEAKSHVANVQWSARRKLARDAAERVMAAEQARASQSRIPLDPSPIKVVAGAEHGSAHAYSSNWRMLVPSGELWDFRPGAEFEQSEGAYRSAVHRG